MGRRQRDGGKINPAWGEQTKAAFEFLLRQEELFRGKLPEGREYSREKIQQFFDLWSPEQLERAATILNEERDGISLPLDAVLFLGGMIEAQEPLPQERHMPWVAWFNELIRLLCSPDRLGVELSKLMVSLVDDWEPSHDQARRIAGVGENAWAHWIKKGVYRPNSEFPIEECWYRFYLRGMEGWELDSLHAVLEAVWESLPDRRPGALLLAGLTLARCELGNASVDWPESFPTPVSGLQNVFEHGRDTYGPLRSFLVRAIEAGTPMGPALRALVSAAAAQAVFPVPETATEAWCHGAESTILAQVHAAAHEIATKENNEAASPTTTRHTPQSSAPQPLPVASDRAPDEVREPTVEEVTALARERTHQARPVPVVPLTYAELGLFYGQSADWVRGHVKRPGFPRRVPAPPGVRGKTHYFDYFAVTLWFQKNPKIEQLNTRDLTRLNEDQQRLLDPVLERLRKACVEMMQERSLGSASLVLGRDEGHGSDGSEESEESEDVDLV